MNSEITLTLGQLIWFLIGVLGITAIIVFIILMMHGIRVLKEAKLAVKEIPETAQYVREKVDSIFGVAGKVGDTFGKVTGVLGFAERFSSKDKKKEPN